jgi:hypothetical protein
MNNGKAKIESGWGWLVVLGAALLINSVAAQEQSRKFEREVKTSPGQELVLDIQSGGAVNVHGWDQDAVRVRVQLDGDPWHDAQVSVDSTPTGVRLLSSTGNHAPSTPANHRFDISVPHRYGISLSSAGGELTIDNVEGTFHGSTPGGRISIEHARGHAELSTGGGEVHVADSELTGSVTTADGRVNLSHVSGGLHALSGSHP